MTYLITKGNIQEKLRPKMPFGHGRGQVSEETEIRKEYPGKEGGPSDIFKHPDNVNFGKNRFLETNYSKHYKTTKGDPLAKGDFDKTQQLGNEIKLDSKSGHVLKSKEEHANKYDKPKVEGEHNPKPDTWMKGKNEKKNLEFKGDTTQKTHYQGHDDGYANKQNERFDNLKCNGIKNRDKTTYGEKHHGKSPDVKADKEMFSHNYTKGKAGHKFLQNPDSKIETAYNNHFNETLKVDGIKEKPHFGKDDKTKDFLYQYHGGYYHVDEKKND